ELPRLAESRGREGVSDLSHLVLGLALAPAAVYDLSAAHVAAEARVLLGLAAPEAVVHVQRRHAVAELPQRVPEAGGVRPSRDEADDLAALGNELALPDVALDALTKRPRLHRRQSARGAARDDP